MAVAARSEDSNDTCARTCHWRCFSRWTKVALDHGSNIFAFDVPMLFMLSGNLLGQRPSISINPCFVSGALRLFYPHEIGTYMFLELQAAVGNPVLDCSPNSGINGYFWWAQGLAFLGLIALSAFVIHTIFGAGLRIELLKLEIDSRLIHFKRGTVVGLIGPFLFISL